MKLELDNGVLSIDACHAGDSFDNLIAMIELLGSKKVIDQKTLLKVKGLNIVLCVKLTVELCNKLGYLFLAVALAENGDDYIVQMTCSDKYPAGSIIN